jgi:acyl carrier protein
MSREDLLGEVQEVFRDVFDEPNLEITEDSNADSVPEWDSMAHLNLLTAIQQKFKVKFTLADMQHLRNVGDLLDLLERKLAEKET